MCARVCVRGIVWACTGVHWSLVTATVAGNRRPSSWSSSSGYTLFTELTAYLCSEARAKCAYVQTLRMCAHECVSVCIGGPTTPALGGGSNKQRPRGVVYWLFAVPVNSAHILNMKARFRISSADALQWVYLHRYQWKTGKFAGLFSYIFGPEWPSLITFLPCNLTSACNLTNRIVEWQ